MSEPISTADMRRVLDAALTFYAAKGTRDLAHRVVATVGRLCPADVLHYNEIDLARKITLKVALNDNDGTDEHIHTFSEFVDHHPIIQAIGSTGDASPRTFSDIISRQDWNENPLHREFFQTAGVGDHDQLAFALPGFDAKRWIVGVALNRKWGAITDRDRAVVELLYPHITQAYMTARRADHFGETLQALQHADMAAISLNAHGQITWLTRKAAQHLRRYYPRHRSAALPEKVLAWVRPKLAMLFRAGLASPTLGEAWTPLRHTGPTGILSIRASAQADGMLLTFTERRLPTTNETAHLLPALTPRQREIVTLLCEGMGEKDIARELQLARSTVHTYITALYTTLGVTSRSELLARFIRPGLSTGSFPAHASPQVS